MPQVLTANRLTDGEVVYWAATKNWVTAFADAEILPEAMAEPAMAQAAAAIERREIVGAYLFDVRVNGHGAVPVKIREVIRAAGPTVRRDLGKQADDVPLR